MINIEIREKGYKFRGWKLGEKVLYLGNHLYERRKVEIVAFDESGRDLCCIAIGIGHVDGGTKYITSALKDAQIRGNIYWVYDDEIEKIKKSKTPKYVRVVEEPKEEYYSDKIGNVYKVKEDLDDKFFIKIKGHGLALISKEDCEPVTKEELIQVGSCVKIKKYKKEKYNNLDEDEISLWKEHQGRIYIVKEKESNRIEFEESSWIWDINTVKPILDREID